MEFGTPMDSLNNIVLMIKLDIQLIWKTNFQGEKNLYDMLASVWNFSRKKKYLHKLIYRNFDIILLKKNLRLTDQKQRAYDYGFLLDQLEGLSDAICESMLCEIWPMSTALFISFLHWNWYFDVIALNTNSRFNILLKRRKNRF